MYRRPKFLEVLLQVREDMAREADYDVDRFSEIVRSGNGGAKVKEHKLTENGSENGVSASKPRRRRVVKGRS